MEKRITDRAFFTQPAEDLAKALIGKIICHEVGNENEKFVIKARIKTTEAYRHTDDVTDANRENENNAQLLEGGHIHLYGELSSQVQHLRMIQFKRCPVT